MQISLVDIISAVGVLVILWKAMRLTPKEGQVLDADAILKYQTALTTQINISEELRKCINLLDEDAKAWHAKQEKFEDTIVKLNLKIENLQTAVDLLSSQVTLLGGEPFGKKKYDKKGGE
jgi:hypothetical protein